MAILEENSWEKTLFFFTKIHKRYLFTASARSGRWISNKQIHKRDLSTASARSGRWITKQQRAEKKILLFLKNARMSHDQKVGAWELFKYIFNKKKSDDAHPFSKDLNYEDFLYFLQIFWAKMVTNSCTNHLFCSNVK